MTLLAVMFPFYLFGNLHCLGMCGPLVMMIGKHPYRYLYFLGRLTSFSLGGLLAGAFGAILNLMLDNYHIPTAASLFFGSVILVTGLYTLFGKYYPGSALLSRILAPWNQKLSTLLLQDKPWATFLFGFLTLSLPCGQTFIVFSACAMSGSAFVGFINGFAFALLTSPSLLLAMNAHKVLWRLKGHYHTITGWCAILIGLLAIFRGLADLGFLPHLTFDPGFTSGNHIVFY